MMIARIRGMIAKTLGIVLLVLTLGRAEIDWTGCAGRTSSDPSATPVSDTLHPSDKDAAN